MADSAETAGGVGGNTLSIDLTKPSDRLLVIAAIKGRWATPEATRRKIMDATLAAMNAGSARDAIGCARVFLAADKINQSDEHRHLKEFIRRRRRQRGSSARKGER